jgi:hypothetical protein
MAARARGPRNSRRDAGATDKALFQLEILQQGFGRLANAAI